MNNWAEQKYPNAISARTHIHFKIAYRWWVKPAFIAATLLSKITYCRNLAEWFKDLGDRGVVAKQA